MEDNQENIIQFLKIRGPVLPVEVAKHINTNILIASANLSELSSNGRVKISRVKIGGSPLYYVPGQEAQLQRFAENLNEKDKRAYDMLLQKKVLRDNELEPLMRVTLRSIKDYAVPLQVNFKGNSEIFWKWYLLTAKEAEDMVRAMLKDPDELKTEEVQKRVEEEKKEEPKKVDDARVEKKEEGNRGEVHKKPEEVQRKIVEKTAEKKTVKKEKISHDDFIGQSMNYFNKNKIVVLSKEPIRKGEIEFIVQIPSALGNLEYYCRARKKKTINDSDLASAFVQGQLRKLPVLLLTDGELTKRAKEMLQKDFKGMSVMKF
ncbi:MAG: hypothetical protein KKC75_01430 [Nanoarchaeota archaeon]|nr:hypothetical protein [Nanoarchaeota archaeon]MBU1004386.1 hypothetical protein [Nanoarchaeota archaeon]MBU1946727.1 hypothetical protein [Nanoarchaeota archaeon]